MASHVTRRVRTLRVHCPIDRATADLIAAGRVAEIDPESPLAAILAIVDRDGPLGDFGLYRSVVELGTGWELFRPSAAARPTLGAPGERTVSPTAILTLYVAADADPDAESSAIDAIMAAHPWEVPVIERYDSTLVVPP